MAKIIAGSSSVILAKQISSDLKIDIINSYTEKFQDEELRIQLEHGVYEEDVIIVQSTSRPANDHLMELLLLVDAAKRSGARRVIAIVPYFGYSRQDRLSYPFGPISSRLVANLLEASGVNHLITVELHSQQSEGFFKIGVQNLTTTPIFADILKSRQNTVIVSPDIGGIVRARSLSSILGFELAIINKTRKYPNTCETNNLIGNVQNKNCILIDDIIDTGETLCKAAQLLIDNGALAVEAIATHGVISSDAIENIQNSPIKKLTITNTIENVHISNKIVSINITSILITSLMRIIKH